MRNMQQLQPGAKSVLMTSAFYGYNHNTIIGDGEMFDMQNMSGDNHPLLGLRHKRGITSLDIPGEESVQLTGIHGRDQLVFVRGSQVFYNSIPVSGLSVSSEGPKQIVSMGAYVCIWPDKKFFNTADLTDYGSMERPWTGNSEDVSLIMCRGDGTNYDMSEIETGDAPPDPYNNQMWIDGSGETDVLRQWNSLTEEWVEVPTVYTKIQCAGIGTGIREYDTVEISGLALGGADPDARLAAEVDELNNAMIVYFAGDNYIVVAGLLSQAIEQGGLAEATIHADLNLPDLDYVWESNNRLWGCKYGMVDGETVNQIRATKLGDFRNWNCFMGLATDSWYGNVGTDGPFTGCITQRGYPVFFKENAIHRVSGLTPDSFSIQTTIARGVQRGSWRSLCVVAENIYYKARDAVMMYDGNLPVSISDQLGDILYSDARAGVLKDKYYISMKDANEHYTQFVYDTTHGTWWKEDAVQALGYGAVEDELFYIDEAQNTLVSVMGSYGDEENDFDWAAEFDLYGVHYRQGSAYDDPRRVRNKKYISLFKIRMELEENAYARLWIKYDDKLYEYIGEKEGTSLRTFVLPVRPKRCDHIRFKITGNGGVKVFSISRIMEVGGDG